jgi:hypothetical protein
MHNIFNYMHDLIRRRRPDPSQAGLSSESSIISETPRAWGRRPLRLAPLPPQCFIVEVAKTRRPLRHTPHSRGPGQPPTPPPARLRTASTTTPLQHKQTLHTTVLVNSRRSQTCPGVPRSRDQPASTSPTPRHRATPEEHWARGGEPPLVEGSP